MRKIGSLKTGETSLSLLPPVLEMEGIKVTDWKDNYNPKLNGKPIKLGQYERSRSLAISPDGNRFVLGTEWYLRCLDKEGMSSGKRLHQVLYGSKHLRNGRAVVAGFGDGTIRWFRWKTVKNYLPSFHTKTKDAGSYGHQRVTTPQAPVEKTSSDGI